MIKIARCRGLSSEGMRAKLRDEISIKTRRNPQISSFKLRFQSRSVKFTIYDSNTVAKCQGGSSEGMNAKLQEEISIKPCRNPQIS